MALLLTLALCLCLGGCSGGGTQDKDVVPVQSVSMLMGLDLSGANRFCGVAEARSTEKVKKDSKKDIDEVKVSVGDEVKKGDVLFTYDLESVRLSVEAAQLEVEQLANSITSYDKQISELEKDKRSAGSGEKLSYSLQIQETMLDKAEAEYNLKKKEKELAKLEKSAKKTKVKAKVDGVVQSISQSELSGGDFEDEGSGGEDVFLTIVETGTYRVKGIANETNISDLYQDMPVTVYSRTDYTQQWQGVISEIDTGSAEKPDDQDGDMGGEGEESESSSRYTFYVQLENSDGMMMGQHLYILPGVFEQGQGIHLNSSFVEQDGDAAYVWAASSKDTLERRAVTLGAYDEATDSYEIAEGITVEDYVTPVAPGLAEGQKVVKYDSESYSEEDADSSADAEGSSYGEEYYEGEESAAGEEFYEGEGSALDEENFEDGDSAPVEEDYGDDEPTEEQEHMEEAPATLVAAG